MQLFHLTRSAVIQIAKTVQWLRSRKNWKRHAGTWLSRLPLTKMEISAGTSSWPSRISHFTGSFVGHSPSEMLCPPAWKLKINHEESNQTSSAPKSTERSFTSIQMVHTHLLRNILSNYWCGVHRACTNNPLKSDRRKLDDMAGKPI